MSNPEKEQIAALESLGYDAMSEVTRRYGDGDIVVAEIKELPYHNVDHTLRVRQAAKVVARDMGLSYKDTQLAVLAASAHDVIHESTNGKSPEQLSAEWVTERMRSNGMPEEDCDAVRSAILGTSCILDDDGFVLAQEIRMMSFPDERSGLIAACVASADMEALAAPYGPRVSHDMLREMTGLSGDEIMSNIGLIQRFQRVQLRFMDEFRYAYPGADFLFGGYRQHAYLHHLSLLQDIENGHVTTWQQVIDADTAFEKMFEI